MTKIPPHLWWTAPPLAWSLAWLDALSGRDDGEREVLPVGESVQEKYGVDLREQR